MRKMKDGTKPRRVRRQFTPEFKAGAVRLVLEEGKTIAQGNRSGVGLSAGSQHAIRRA